MRVSLGLSFHDESSTVEASIEGLYFAPDISENPTSELNHGTVDEEKRHDDFKTQLSDHSDIQMVER